MSLLSAVLQEAEKATTEEFAKHRNEYFSRLKDLSERVQTLSWSLQQNIIDNYFNFTPTKSLEQLNYKVRKENIVNEWDKLNNTVEHLLEKYQPKDVEFRNCFDKLKKYYEHFERLSVAVEAKRVLETANHEFRRYQYSDAMLSVSNLRDNLKRLKFDGNLAKAVANIISQAETFYSIYSANLGLEWEDIFSWSEKKGIRYMTYSLSVQQSDPVVIQNVLMTLYATNRLNIELNLFSHFFIDTLLHNVIRYNCDIFTEDAIAPNHTIIFNIKIDLEENTKPTFQTVFTGLMAVFDFLQSTLGIKFDNENNFISVFAESIRNKFFHKIIEDCIRNNLPSCDSSYEKYKNLVAELDVFNKFLIELQFVKSEDSPLNKFINDTECVLYNKKCDKLLSEVRELLKESISYGTVTVGDVVNNGSDSIVDITDNAMWDISRPLFLPKCVISQNVLTIMSTIIDHVTESAKLPEKYSRQLISYIRHIAVMYQSIVPQKFQINLESCPLDIALFFNNCFYLAHGLLGPPWHTILPSPISEDLTTVMVECIQDLRALGLEKMSSYLQNQKNIIMKNIQPEEIQPWTNETFEKFDGAINEALILMKDLKLHWLDILPSRMYELALCMLVDALCQATLQRIFADSRPVDEELVYMIAERLEDVKVEVLELFESNINFTKKIEVWPRFLKMPQILRAQLLELSRLWNGNNELSKWYTCEEIRQIIKMRFPNDKYRLKILMEIQ